jgi:hypothetical protein
MFNRLNYVSELSCLKFRLILKSVNITNCQVLNGSLNTKIKIKITVNPYCGLLHNTATADNIFVVR